VQLDDTQKQISIRAVASQLGENTATADAEVVGDGGITLNSKYILDALAVMSSDTVELCFNGKLEPCVLRESGKNDYTHVIMPLKS
jgi:DNA polymerase III sliding clamp (beta) subunit (PCNA family)